jgi:hypothetical protein
MFDIVYLVLGILLGGAVLTFYHEKPTIVVKHPTPFNTNSTTYKDKAGDCYKYRFETVECTGENDEEIPAGN